MIWSRRSCCMKIIGHCWQPEEIRRENCTQQLDNKPKQVGKRTPRWYCNSLRRGFASFLLHKIESPTALKMGCHLPFSRLFLIDGASFHFCRSHSHHSRVLVGLYSDVFHHPGAWPLWGKPCHAMCCWMVWFQPYWLGILTLPWLNDKGLCQGRAILRYFTSERIQCDCQEDLKDVKSTSQMSELPVLPVEDVYLPGAPVTLQVGSQYVSVDSIQIVAIHIYEVTRYNPDNSDPFDSITGDQWKVTDPLVCELYDNLLLSGGRYVATVLCSEARMARARDFWSYAVVDAQDWQNGAHFSALLTLNPSISALLSCKKTTPMAPMCTNTVNLRQHWLKTLTWPPITPM